MTNCHHRRFPLHQHFITDLSHRPPHHRPTKEAKKRKICAVIVYFVPMSSYCNPIFGRQTSRLQECLLWHIGIGLWGIKGWLTARMIRCIIQGGGNYTQIWHDWKSGSWNQSVGHILWFFWQQKVYWKKSDLFIIIWAQYSNSHHN